MSALLMLAGMRRWTTSRGTLERCGRLPGTIARDDMPYYGCNVAVYRVHENIGRAKNVGLTEHFAGHDQPGVSVRENVRLLGTIYKCQKSAHRRVLGRGMEGVRHDHRNMQERRPQAVSKSVVK